MTAGEIRHIAKTMRDFGIAKIKVGELELTLGPDGLTDKTSAEGGPSVQDAGLNPAPATRVEGLTEEDNDIIKHKAEQLQSILKLSDVELIDELFPDHTETTEESA